MSRGKDLASLFGATLVSLGTTMGPKLAVQTVYKTLFNKRITSEEPYRYSVDDFPGLKRDRHHFFSDDGQILVGYMYYYQEQPQKGVVVMAHGFGGGGHLTYLDCANYLAKNGFYVFAYDATGNDESEGDGIIGFPEGIIDLNNAINYVESLDKFNNYPIMLFGHSWGAYSVCNVLYYHPEVKAVVAMSGFNNSADLIRTQGHIYSNGGEEAVMPFIKNHEKELFGNWANSTAIRGFDSTKAHVFIVHSGDDKTVPYEAGYKIYYEKYKNNPRFTFRLFESKGHGTVYYSEEGMKYSLEWDDKWKSFLKSNPSEENKKKFIADNINRAIWNDRLNHELFEEIITFYNENL